MLASLGDYIQAWEPYEMLPTILICLLAWLLGGGYLFQKILGPRTERRKYPLQQGVLVSFLAGAGGGIALVALYFIANAIAPVEADPYSLPINWLGVALGAIGYFVIAFLVVFSMNKLSAGDTIKASAVPIVVPVLVGAIVFGCSFRFLSYPRVQEERIHYKKVYDTGAKLNKIYNSLENRRLQKGKVTASLEDLVKDSFLKPEDLQSPANPKGRGFFFNGDKTNTDVQSRKMILCDYTENFKDKGRAVLYEGGYVEFLSPESFQDRLEQIENVRFAQALQEAEKK